MTLLNLEVDLLFFDTTSTYFETDEADPQTGEAPKGFRTFGHSKDHRPDLPQVVLGLAVTRTGIPIRVWTFPGNTADQTLIRQVKDDLLAWKLGRVVWVTDRGFASAENRRYLQRAGGHYVTGEKLRSDSAEARAALARAGRYHTIADNLEVKEVVLDGGTMRDRFVVCRNPDEAVRDAAIRDRVVGGLEAAIAGSDALAPAARAKLACDLRATPTNRRFLRVTKAGLLRIDRVLRRLLRPGPTYTRAGASDSRSPSQSVPSTLSLPRSGHPTLACWQAWSTAASAESCGFRRRVFAPAGGPPGRQRGE